MKIKIVNETRCLRCKKQLAFCFKWLMPEESVNWNCNNCSEKYHVYAEHNDQTGLHIIINAIRHNFEVELADYNHDEEKNKWRKTK